jgi:hypothetical protein
MKLFLTGGASKFKSCRSAIRPLRCRERSLSIGASIAAYLPMGFVLKRLGILS